MTSIPKSTFDPNTKERIQLSCVSLLTSLGPVLTIAPLILNQTEFEDGMMPTHVRMLSSILEDVEIEIQSFKTIIKELSGRKI